MAAIHSNRLIPVVGGIVALMALFVLLRACGTDAGNEVLMREVPRAPSPDADSPAETVRTLVAEVAHVRSTSDAIREENERLLRELQRRDQQLDREVSRRVTQELERQGARDRSGLESVMERIERLSGRVEDISQRPATTTPLDDDAWDIPVGLGLDGDRPGSGRLTAPPRTETVTWVEPLGWEDNNAGLARRTLAGTGRVLETGRSLVTDSPRRDASTVDRGTRTLDRYAGTDLSAEAERRPVYTVPRNATLVGSTAMTALIGRIPRRGTVEDPMHFKIIQGRDNLAANGLTLPGVEGMVWSGTATGDWTLSCVRGQLDSVTLVFADGTVRTLPDPDPATGVGEPRGGTGDSEPLGWISDARGYPCISGERVTNAPQFLASRAGLLGLQAAAEALASGETTTTLTSDGTRIGTITGDQGRYIAGRTISGGTEEVVRWLIERQEQSFDAVVTRPGVSVSLHIDRELRIDHVPEPTGRRLTYEYDSDTGALRLN
ncbi:TIGR03752 family integrating conjugative element protein [uncultured Halomonas sp.]|uniref:TIGR03752 family integrating conjugative element protein n=1 Tax=uncultured Halomonas sp. TaxID=173971 RepID=UPI0026176314|nr:TIGR03752 family integrating conjugative element protein [uncultured Halomonas sp.]